MKKNGFLVLALFFACAILAACGGSTYSVDYYLIDDNPLSDTYGDYVHYHTDLVAKSGYLEKFNGSVSNSGATGWYYGPMLRDPAEKLTAENIERIKSSTQASEFVPEWYGTHQNENPTRVTSDLRLYACYGEKIELHYHYFRNIEPQISEAATYDPIANVKNASVDVGNIPEELVNSVVSQVNVGGTDNYCCVGYAYLNKDANGNPYGEPADKVMDANLGYKDSDGNPIYKEIKSLSSEISNIDLDIYLLYAEKKDVKIMKWEWDRVNGRGKYVEIDEVAVGNGGSLSDKLEPNLAGCVGWYCLDSEKDGSKITQICNGDVITEKSTPDASLKTFSFKSTINSDTVLFPAYLSEVEVRFRHYDGHYVTGGEIPSFKLKEVYRNDGTTSFSIKCRASDEYTIPDFSSFPTEALLLKDFNIPRFLSDDVTHDDNRRESIWDSNTSPLGAYRYGDSKDGHTNTIRWGQVLYRNAYMQPKRVSQCRVDSSETSNNMILLDEVKLDDGYMPKLRVVPRASNDNIVYFYAISELDL